MTKQAFAIKQLNESIAHTFGTGTEVVHRINVMLAPPIDKTNLQ